MRTRCPDCKTEYDIDPNVLLASHGLARCFRCNALFDTTISTAVADAGGQQVPVIDPRFEISDDLEKTAQLAAEKLLHITSGKEARKALKKALKQLERERAEGQATDGGEDFAGGVPPEELRDALAQGPAGEPWEAAPEEPRGESREALKAELKQELRDELREELREELQGELRQGEPVEAREPLPDEAQTAFADAWEERREASADTLQEAVKARLAPEPGERSGQAPQEEPQRDGTRELPAAELPFDVPDNLDPLKPSEDAMLDVADTLYEKRSHRGLIYGLVATLLLTAFGLQLAWQQRELLLDRFPWLSPVCAYLPCRPTMVRAPELLRVLERDIQPATNQPGALSLQATVLNEAALPQPLPDLQLSLVDNIGRVLIRRRLAPDEYMFPPPPGNRLIDPGEVFTITLDFRDPGYNATGFVIDFL